LRCHDPWRCLPHATTCQRSRVQGEKMKEQLTVERLKVRRDWYKGLAADPIDHSHPDVGDGDEPPARGAGQRVGLQARPASYSNFICTTWICPETTSSPAQPARRPTYTCLMASSKNWHRGSVVMR
jgi:hypothetical protein